MKYGLYQSYIENPERFFAPAKPILSVAKPVKHLRRYKASPTYPKADLEPQFLMTYDRPEPNAYEAASVTFENSQYESWWRQHKHWKARQRGVTSAHYSEDPSRPQSRNLNVNLVDLSFPAPPTASKLSVERPTLEKKRVKVEERPPSGINFTYIQPKLKTYLEYLKAPANAHRPRTNVSTRSQRSVVSGSLSVRARSRGTNDSIARRPLVSMVECDINPLMNPKLSEMFADAELLKRKAKIGESLNISPKRISFKEESVHVLPTRSRRKRLTNIQKYEAGGMATSTPSSVPSPPLTSRML